jgi:hypothetical protein
MASMNPRLVWFGRMVAGLVVGGVVGFVGALAWTDRRAS